MIAPTGASPKYRAITSATSTSIPPNKAVNGRILA
ncbi:Uncharacterised protein [Staphylococcus aureus]|nr:Uncharacterised protein [Staphylococcus aureus]